MPMNDPQAYVQAIMEAGHSPEDVLQNPDLLAEWAGQFGISPQELEAALVEALNSATEGAPPGSMAQGGQAPGAPTSPPGPPMDQYSAMVERARGQA